MAIDVRSAVNSAQNYFESLKDIISPKLSNSSFEEVELALEEVELSEEQDFWFITLGFNRPTVQPKSAMRELLPSPTYKYEREYRIFKVNSETGDVHSMKIREL